MCTLIIFYPSILTISSHHGRYPPGRYQCRRMQQIHHHRPLRMFVEKSCAFSTALVVPLPRLSFAVSVCRLCLCLCFPCLPRFPCCHASRVW